METYQPQYTKRTKTKIDASSSKRCYFSKDCTQFFYYQAMACCSFYADGELQRFPNLTAVGRPPSSSSLLMKLADFDLAEYNTIKTFVGDASLMNRSAESNAFFERIQTSMHLC